MNQGLEIFETKESITPLAVKECNCKEVPIGTVLLSFKLSIGKVGIARSKLFTNEAIAALPIKEPERLDSVFLRWALKSIDLTVGLDRAAKGLTLNKEKLERVRIPLLPLPEQHRIAAILDQANTLRTKRREALAQLDSLTQSIFIEMFGDPIDNRSNYPVSKLIELVDTERPISYGILMPGPDVEGGVKYIRVVDMKNGGIELSGIRRTTEEMSNSFKRSLLKAGDLLMSIRGHVGRLAVVPQELEGANITQDSARLAISGANSIYVRECLRTLGFQRWMAKHTKGVAVRGINLGDVKLMPIPLPPKSLQDEFARRALAIDKMLGSHKDALAGLSSLFASLQQRAFRGEL
jgi:type I restriction enzyme S subunit